jgi:hypothetical protein
VSSKRKLVLCYFLSLVFAGATLVALHLEWFPLVILFLFAGVLSGWKLNPVPQTSKEFLRSRSGKTCGVLLVLVSFIFVFIILIQLFKLFVLPGWLLGMCLYGFIFPVLIITFIIRIKYDLNAADKLDKNREISG